MTNSEPRLIRAAYDASAVTVYQAYSPGIAGPAVRAGTFVPPFSRDRMTWIKPSFGWMMHRSGWATKPGQERILSIQVSRSGFEWALEHASLSHFAPGVHPSRQAWAEQKAGSPVRVQWDPDRSLDGGQLPRRAIQIGLSGSALRQYADDWIVSITDITPLARDVAALAAAGRLGEAEGLLPAERVYPIAAGLAARLGAAAVGFPGPASEIGAR